MLWAWIELILRIKLLLLQLVPSLTLSNLVAMVILYVGAMLYMDNCSPKRAVSVDDKLLRKFGRLHDVEDASDFDDNVAEYGYKNLKPYGSDPVRMLRPSISPFLKLGAAPRKTVRWASDVKDHVPKSRKKKGKDYNSCSKKKEQGQEGNRGGGGKDEKQVRKHGGEV